jgi:triacylglycerol lipase
MRLIRAIVSALLCASYLFAIPAHANTEYAKTKYPIVLVHGVAGTSKFFGIADYWWKVPGDLRYNGTQVYVVNMSAFNGEVSRGESLVRQIRDILIVSGASKVNLIAHSQGGYDSRYAAAVIPQSVASITTISTPHRGTHLADFLASTPSIVQDFLAGGASLAGQLLGLFVGDPQQQDPLAALRLMTLAGSADFNRRFPTAGLGSSCSTNGASTDVRSGYTQRLYSWAGASSATNILDVIDPLLVLGDATIRLRGGGDNDGAVPVCSTRFGQFLGTYGWNHIDEINHVFGLRGLFSADPVVTIRTHANRLKLAGL